MHLMHCIICWYLTLSSHTVQKREKTLAVNIIDCVLVCVIIPVCIFSAVAASTLTTMATDGPDRVRGWSDVSEGMTGEREVLPFD